MDQWQLQRTVRIFWAYTSENKIFSSNITLQIPTKRTNQSTFLASQNLTTISEDIILLVNSKSSIAWNRNLQVVNRTSFVHTTRTNCEPVVFQCHADNKKLYNIQSEYKTYLYLQSSLFHSLDLWEVYCSLVQESRPAWRAPSEVYAAR